MKRVWKPLDGHHYSVSNDGLIRNDDTGKIKATRDDRYGYERVELYRNGTPFYCRVHKLVAESFVDNPDNKPQINHKDGNKHNNSYKNLEWVTAKENMEHSVRNGLFVPSRSMLGKKNPNGGRKGLPIKIVETGEVFSSITECAQYIHGNTTGICDALKGERHTHRGYHFEYI